MKPAPTLVRTGSRRNHRHDAAYEYEAPPAHGLIMAANLATCHASLKHALAHALALRTTQELPPRLLHPPHPLFTTISERVQESPKTRSLGKKSATVEEHFPFPDVLVAEVLRVLIAHHLLTSIKSGTEIRQHVTL